MDRSNQEKKQVKRYHEYGKLDGIMDERNQAAAAEGRVEQITDDPGPDRIHSKPVTRSKLP